MINPLIGLGVTGRYEITYLSQCWSQDELEREQKFFMKYPFVTLVGVCNRNRFNSPEDNLRLEFPLEVLNLMDLDYYTELENLLKYNRFDIVQVEHSQMSWVVPLVRKLAPQAYLNLDLHNIETTVFERWLRYSPLYEPENIRARFEKMRRWEDQVWPWYDGCFAVSTVEAQVFQEATNHHVPVRVLPTGGGIDLARFPWNNQVEKREVTSLVYIGTLEWYPNAHGLLWFVKEVLPLLKEKYPDIRLYIGGYGSADKNLMQCIEKRNDIIFLGQLDDEREVLARAGIFVVPLWIGSGARVKIPTAWAAGVPIVATTIGAEGLEYSDGENIFVTDNPTQFANRISELIDNPDLALSFSRNGRALAERCYSLDHAVKKYDELYTDIVEKDQESPFDESGAKVEFSKEEWGIRHILQMKHDMSTLIKPTSVNTPENKNRFLQLGKNAIYVIKNEGWRSFFRKVKIRALGYIRRIND
jgi:polysaccharide biosynthesis protein PslH